MPGPPAPSSGKRTRGTVTKLVIGQSYGFIRTKDRTEVFFHRSDMSEDTPFNSLEVGDAVSFELIVDAISGSRAIKVTKPKR